MIDKYVSSFNKHVSSLKNNFSDGSTTEEAEIQGACNKPESAATGQLGGTRKQDVGTGSRPTCYQTAQIEVTHLNHSIDL